MVGVKLYAYEIGDVEYQRVSLYEQVGFFNQFKTRVLYPSIAYTTLNEFGLYGRLLESTNSAGQYTFAVIYNLYEEGGVLWFSHSDWYNQIPLQNASASIYMRLPNNMFTQVAESDFSADLVEDEIESDFKLETNQKFDLEVSSLAIKLDASEAVNTFMDAYWNNEGFVIGVQLLLDGQGEFWGVCERDDISLDLDEQTYTLTSYDWFKYLLNTKGKNLLPTLRDAGTEITPKLSIELFLLYNLKDFNGITVSLSVNNSNLMDAVEIIGYRQPLPSNEWVNVADSVTVEEFIVEMQKHYGAFIFYDKDRVLHFINRNVPTAREVVIDDLILEEYPEKTYMFQDFKRLLLNVKGEWSETSPGVWQSYEGWAFVKDVDGALEVNTGVSEQEIATENNDFLDLRQNLPTPYFEYVIFYDRTPEDRYNDYKELFKETEVFTFKVDTLDVYLMDKIVYQGTDYILKQIKKNYIEETSEIKFVRKF